MRTLSLIRVGPLRLHLLLAHLLAHRPSPSVSYRRVCPFYHSLITSTLAESCGTKASYLSDSGIEAARHYLANRELPKPEDAGPSVEADTVPSPAAKTEETDDAQHIYFKLDGFHPTPVAVGDNLELMQEDEEDSQEETNLDMGGARNSQTQSQCSVNHCLMTSMIALIDGVCTPLLVFSVLFDTWFPCLMSMLLLLQSLENILCWR